MRGAEALALNERRSLGANPPDFCRDGLMIGPNHHRERRAASIWAGVQHMCYQRQAGQGMQHLRQA